VPGLTLKEGKCELDSASVRGPYCSSKVSYLSYDAQSKKCVAITGNPKSAAGSYEGDCFTIKAVPTDSGLVKDATYKVTAQERVAGDDRMLTLRDGKPNHIPLPWQWGCETTGGPERKILASALLDAGAQREGWAYGALAMPYKYFRSDKSFVAGAPLGAYLGWRSGTAGSGTTIAAALTLGSVKANTVDPTKIDPATQKATVTGNAEVAALSGAIGIMFDVSKERGTKPFKVGLFRGKDRINGDPTIDYKYNRKWWTAIQIGYDFTDN
jgi:hypothetical protein